MEYAPLGRSGLKISPVCPGAMNFGAPAGVAGCDEPEAGRAIRGRRDAVVLATKAFLPQGPGPNDRGLSRVHLPRALEASLRRLGTDNTDLYQCQAAVLAAGPRHRGGDPARLPAARPGHADLVPAGRRRAQRPAAAR